MPRFVSMRAGQIVMALLLAATALPAMAQKAAVAAAASLSAPPQPSTALNLQDLVRKPLVLRGMLGSEQIQLSLQPKPDEDGLQGTYFVFGQGVQVQLAGEVEQNDLSMEESYNGKDVSGDWQGSLQNGVLSGTWSSLDGSVNKPFALKIAAP